MSAYLTFPISQQLRFVNRTEEANTIPTFRNRLYNHFKPKGVVHMNYCQLIEQTDPLVIQFRTSYTSFNMYLVKQNGYVKTSYSGSQVQIHSYSADDGTSIKIYNVTIDVSNLIGEYFFTLEATSVGEPTALYWSEPFNVQAEHEDTQVFKYGGNSGIRDGVRWGDANYTIDYYQQNRINSRILTPTYGMTKSTYNDSNSELTTLNAYPNATDALEIKEVPFYIIEKLDWALGCDEFYIDDTLYNIDDDYDLSMWGKKQMGSGIIPLVLVEYANTDDILQTGDDYEQPPFAIYAGEGVALFAETGKALGY